MGPPCLELIKHKIDMLLDVNPQIPWTKRGVELSNSSSLGKHPLNDYKPIA